MSRQDLQTAMEATNAMIRDDSHLLLDKYGERLRDAVNKGEITHTVDRGRARLLLANVPSLELPAQLSLTASTVKVIHFTEPLFLIAICVWSLFLFGWWGAAAFPAVYFFFVKGHQSASLGLGLFPILVAGAFLGFAYFAHTSQQMWWGVFCAAVMILQRVAYSVAVAAVRAATFESPEFCRFAITQDAIWLRHLRRGK